MEVGMPHEETDVCSTAGTAARGLNFMMSHQPGRYIYTYSFKSIDSCSHTHVTGPTPSPSL